MLQKKLQNSSRFLWQPVVDIYRQLVPYKTLDPTLAWRRWRRTEHRRLMMKRHAVQRQDVFSAL